MHVDQFVSVMRLRLGAVKFLRLALKVASRNDVDFVDVILCHFSPTDVVDISDHKQHALLLYFQKSQNRSYSGLMGGVKSTSTKSFSSYYFNAVMCCRWLGLMRSPAPSGLKRRRSCKGRNIWKYGDLKSC